MSEIIKEDSDLRIAKAEQGMLMHMNLKNSLRD